MDSSGRQRLLALRRERRVLSHLITGLERYLRCRQAGLQLRGEASPLQGKVLDFNAARAALQIRPVAKRVNSD